MQNLITILLPFYSAVSWGDTEMEWPFDQAQNVAAITTKQVVNESKPILMVVHYLEDDSWSFTCGTTNHSEDLMIVGMGEIVGLDPTLSSIADLPPGWYATRESVNADWVRVKE